MFGERPNKKISKLIDEEYESFTPSFDNHSAILEAEAIANSAFRAWVEDAGIGENRTRSILNSPSTKRANVLNVRERQLVIRAGKSAIEQSYTDLDDPLQDAS